MTPATDINGGRGISNEACHELMSKKRKAMHLSSCTLLTRWRTSILKWACHADCKTYKRRLAYSVTGRILAQNNFIL